MQDNNITSLNFSVNTCWSFQTFIDIIIIALNFKHFCKFKYYFEPLAFSQKNRHYHLNYENYSIFLYYSMYMIFRDIELKFE